MFGCFFLFFFFFFFFSSRRRHTRVLPVSWARICVEETGADEKTINTFATRVRQLILEFGKLKQENAELYEMVDERDAQIKALQEKLSQAEHDYNSLKMAKMMTISDADMEATQKRVAKLIRDVNKCITLLSNQ